VRAEEPSRKSRSTRYWSGRVTQHSDALDLRKGVFSLRDPKEIAASLKRSAERSHRRKADPYRSALSMLAFYINRAGKNLPAHRKRSLQRAKGELRRLFGKG
jgi:phosphoenolpyruvate carboxylase